MIFRGWSRGCGRNLSDLGCILLLDRPERGAENCLPIADAGQDGTVIVGSSA